MTPEQQKALALARARRRRSEAEAQKDNSDALSKVRTASGGFLEGIPVVGPLIRGGVERAAAATLTPFSDKSYDEILQTIQQGTVAEKEANPWLDKGSQVAGGVAGTIPMVMAAPAAFGAAGGGLLARSTASALSGGSLGLADSAIRSEGDPEAMKLGAGAGLAMGLAGPAVGKLLGAGAQALRDTRAYGQAAKLADVPKAAVSRIAKALAGDDIAASQIPSRLAALGDDAMVLDLGPNMRSVGGAVASTPGRGQEIVRGSVEARDAAANRRILDSLDETLGPARSPVQINEAIRQGQRDTGAAYAESFRDAMPVFTDDIARSLDQNVLTLRGPAQRAARQVRGMLNGNGGDHLDTNPYTLFQTRNAIDGMLASENNPQVIRLLTETRQQIDDNLARNVPNIKMADAQYEELARQNEGLTRGTQILDSGKTTPRPDDFAREVAEGIEPNGLMVGPSGATFRMSQAARAEIDRIVGTTANDRVALQRAIKGDGSWNREKLATLYGPEKAQRIIDLVDRERLFADTSQQVTRNSESARRLAAQRDLAGSESVPFGVVDSFKAGGVMGAGRAAAVRGAERIMDALAGARRQAVNTGLAEAIAGGKQEAVVKALMSAEGMPKVDRQSIDAIAKALLVGGGTSLARP